MKRLPVIIALVAATLIAVSCNNSRRNEIDARKAALKNKQDSTLLAAQKELSVVDSTLVVVKADYERMKKEVEQHRAELKATEEELMTLNLLRVKRDSLQVQWDLLGAKIKYIHQKQKEME